MHLLPSYDIIADITTHNRMRFIAGIREENINHIDFGI